MRVLNLDLLGCIKFPIISTLDLSLLCLIFGWVQWDKLGGRDNKVRYKI
jgi:hypothetical protein